MLDKAIIRTAQAEDIPALAKLGAETFTETFGHLYREEDLASFLASNHSEDAHRAAIADLETSVWIAEDLHGQAIGFGSAGPCHLPVPNMPTNAGELIRLYVLKSHQGAGLGIALFEKALDFLESHFDNIYLSVYLENHGAQRLYSRYGFEVIYKYNFMVGDHADPEFIMQRMNTIRP